jgi:hypothetical protein
MNTPVDPFETEAPEKKKTDAPSGPEVDTDWQDSTAESHPGVSIESWRRARGWSTED